MPRHFLLLGCAAAALAGCATATDPTASLSDSAGIHEPGSHGSDSSAHGDPSSTADGAMDDTATTTDTGSEPDSSTPIDTGTSGDADDTPTDPTCAAATTNNDCETCCYAAHTDPYNAFASTLTSCACKPANCESQCAATACASPPTSSDAACIACLTTVQTGACKAEIGAVCGSPSGACYPFAQCVITSGCNSKP